MQPNVEAEIRPQVTLGTQPKDAEASPPGAEAGSIPHANPVFGHPAAVPNVQPAPQNFGDVSETQGSTASPADRNPAGDTYKPPTREQIVDSLKRMGQKLPAKEQKAVGERDEILANLQKMGGENGPLIDAPTPQEGFFNSIKRTAWESFQQFAGRNLEELGRNDQEKLAGAAKVYGQDNVKRAADGAILFKPEGSNRFRKLDQQQFDASYEFFINHLLKAVPSLTNIAVTGAGTAAGAMAGPVGAVAGGAAAGAAGAAAGDTVQDKMLSAFGTKDPSFDLGGQIKTDAMVQGAMGAAGGLVTNVLAKQKASELVGAINDAGDPIKYEPGQKLGALAKVRTFLAEYKNTLFPSVGNTPQETGQVIGGAVEHEGQKLGNAAGMVIDKAEQISKETGAKVDATDLLSGIKGKLSSYGVVFEKGSGRALLDQSEIPQYALGSQTGPRAITEMTNYYNELLSHQKFSDGVGIKRLWEDIQAFSTKSQYDSITPMKPTEIRFIRDIRDMAADARNTFLNDTLKGTAEEGTWATAFKNYSDKIDSISSFKQAFQSPQSMETMVDSFSKAPTPGKLEMLDHVQHIFGSDSKEWNSLRGEIIDNIANKGGREGVVDADKAFQFFTKRENRPLVDRLFQGNELPIMIKGMREAKKLSTSGVFEDASKSGFENMLGVMSKLKDPKGLAETAFQYLSGNKKAIDYLMDDGFMNAAQKTYGPEQKKIIMEAMNYLGTLRDNMKVMNVSGTMKYLPSAMTSQAGAKAVAPLVRPLNAAAQGASQINLDQGPDADNNQPESQPTPIMGSGAQRSPG